MRVLAIIPARGGSKAIPRKNVRLLAGVPLVARAVQLCQACEGISEIIVSTEDEEIAMIARRYGAEVLPRSPELAGDAVGLAAVVHEVVTKLEAVGRSYDVVATIQPTSVLIRAATIDKALAMFEDPAADTVLSVYDNTHLNWTLDEAGRAVPLFTERVNRQFLPRILTESGGVIACRRSVVTQRDRIGRSVRLVVLDPDESIDIDTYHDWWLAEKLIQRRRIVFHVVGSPLTGLGHVYRALTLARRLTDHEIFFIVPREDELAERMIKAHFLPVTRYDADPLSVLDQLDPDIVVNDILDTDAGLIRNMKSRGWRVVNFEDQGSGCAEADAVVNALYEAAPHLDHIYTGADYYCLREEFFSAVRRDVRREVETVLVCFGGTDPSGLTVKAVKAIRRLPQRFKLVVILGAGYGDDAALQEALRTLERPAEVVRDTKVISQHMEQADLMVTSGGRTVYEAATVGVPTVVLCQNQRELGHLFACVEHGFQNLGLGAQVPDDRLVDILGGLIDNHEERKEMQRRMCLWDGRGGIARVLRILVGEVNDAAKT